MIAMIPSVSAIAMGVEDIIIAKVNHRHAEIRFSPRRIVVRCLKKLVALISAAATAAK